MLLKSDEVVAVIVLAVRRTTEDPKSTGVEQWKRFNRLVCPYPHATPNRAYLVLKAEFWTNMDIRQRRTAECCKDVVKDPVARLEGSRQVGKLLVFRRQSCGSWHGLLNSTYVDRIGDYSERK